MWIHRRTGPISWTERKTNKEVLNQQKLKKEMMKNKTIQLKYFRHIKTHRTILEAIFEGRPEGKRTAKMQMSVLNVGQNLEWQGAH